MENILQFPVSTLLSKPVPKTAFYRHLEVNTKMKQRFVEDVTSITWLYKLAPSTLNVEEGKAVHEITIFYVRLKEKDCPNDLYLFIDKNVPRHMVFILQHEEEYRLLLNYKEWQDQSVGTFRIVKRFATDWMSFDSLQLPLEGQTMDKVYETFAGYISGYGTKNNDDTKRVVELDTVIEQKTRLAEALQKKVRLEKQVNRQMELNSEARAIKKEIAALNIELDKFKK
ncbi:MAG: DUF4391 domain-containing protein [Phocaeicola sp.]